MAWDFLSMCVCRLGMSKWRLSFAYEKMICFLLDEYRYVSD